MRKNYHFSITNRILNELRAAGHTILCDRSTGDRLVIYRVDDQIFSTGSASQRDVRVLLKQLYENLLVEKSN